MKFSGFKNFPEEVTMVDIIGMSHTPTAIQNTQKQKGLCILFWQTQFRDDFLPKRCGHFFSKFST